MSLEDNISKLSLYDAKKYFRKAQNVVFNYTDMEAKVREATNNEPWGASSTLMDKIAQGTYNYREREEILGMIFRRFTEKTASEWRQIYKALQLLEYLIKHGCERFIDDVRSNLNLIKMLESFHYIDSQGRDQGVNVRNRASQLVALLEDDDRIRKERKKARETSKKYRGMAGGTALAVDSGINAHAGFTKSTSHGISVSADYDSDEDDGYQKPLPYGQETGGSHATFEEYQPTISGGATKDLRDEPGLLSFAPPKEDRNENMLNDLHKHGEENEDEDDDFAEFQSATPSASNPASGINDLLFTATNSTPIVNQMPTASVTPAITTAVSSDPFGSLFTSAKNAPNPAKKVSKPSQPSASIEVDDVFGGLRSSTNQAPSNPTSKGHSEGSKQPEVDLLSF